VYVYDRFLADPPIFVSSLFTKADAPIKIVISNDPFNKCVGPSTNVDVESDTEHIIVQYGESLSQNGMFRNKLLVSFHMCLQRSVV
jgi:hypothetical protein